MLQYWIWLSTREGVSNVQALSLLSRLGSAAANNPDLVKAIKDQGSQVASHTMNHEQLTAVDQATLQSEITEAFSAISGAGGGDTSVIRPPYGSFDTSTWLASGGTLSGLINIEVTSTQVVDAVIYSLMRIKGVQKVFRVNN